MTEEAIKVFQPHSHRVPRGTQEQWDLSHPPRLSQTPQPPRPGTQQFPLGEIPAPVLKDSSTDPPAKYLWQTALQYLYIYTKIDPFIYICIYNWLHVGFIIRHHQ